MMGTADKQDSLFYNIRLERFVAFDHPFRRIGHLIDVERIRKLCCSLYSEEGRPSIPPEQLFLCILGDYLQGVCSERALVRELQCNMALRWFVGLGLNQDAWDHSIFSQNHRRRFNEGGARPNVGMDFENSRGEGWCNIRDEAFLMEWLLNLKRLSLLIPQKT